MNNTFASDLKNARLESGLTQEDCSLLIGVSTARIGRFENGKVTPSLREICAISLLFNRSFESLFNDIFDEVKAHMAASFDSLREDDADGDNFHRKDSLERLRDRLMDYNFDEYDI